MGAIYGLTKDGSLWNFSVIHNFDSAQYPNPPAVSAAGDIFGTLEQGGKYNSGIMYRIDNGTWYTVVLHNFCNTANCADGAFPQSRLLIDSSGNLFGTTSWGGACDAHCGVVFERTAGGYYSVLYNFCSLCGRCLPIRRSGDGCVRQSVRHDAGRGQDPELLRHGIRTGQWKPDRIRALRFLQQSELQRR